MPPGSVFHDGVLIMRLEILQYPPRTKKKDTCKWIGYIFPRISDTFGPALDDKRRKLSCV